MSTNLQKKPGTCNMYLNDKYKNNSHLFQNKHSSVNLGLKIVYAEHDRPHTAVKLVSACKTLAQHPQVTDR